MGGRGSSSGKSSAGKWKRETSAVGHDGKTIDLSGSPLRYNSDDKNVPSQVRTSIEPFEKQRVKNKIEYGRAVDSNGRTLEERRGGDGSVKIAVWALNRSEVYTHTHPRNNEAGRLGGTFSTGDINNFADYGVKVFRAAAAEGTYSIAKGSGFDGAGLKSYFSGITKTAEAEHKNRVSAYRQAYSAVVKQYDAGNATRAQLDSAYKAFTDGKAKSFNTMLVDMHEGLIKGAKKYGYTYTLERRK